MSDTGDTGSRRARYLVVGLTTCLVLAIGVLTSTSTTNRADATKQQSTDSPSSAAPAPTIVTATMSRSKVTAGAPVYLEGQVNPPRAADVTLHLRSNSWEWREMDRTRTDAQGRYRFRVPTWFLGTHAYRAETASDANHSGTVSPSQMVTVRPTYRPAGSEERYRLLRERTRWNPCQPIPYRVNPEDGYPGFVADVKKAFSIIAQATGIELEYVGSTTHTPTNRTKERWPGITVAWATSDEVKQLAGDTIGFAGQTSYIGQGRETEVLSGVVVLDASDRIYLGPGFPEQGVPGWGQVLVHEIAHVIGLGHVKDRSQLMNPVTTPEATRLGAGDLEGLRLLGYIGGCFTNSQRRPVG